VPVDGSQLREAWCGSSWIRSALGAAAIAAFTIGGTFGSQGQQHDVRHLDAFGVTLLALICAAMVLRRRDPRATLLIVGVGVCGYFALGYPWGPVFLPLTLAVGSAVLAGQRLLAWLSCAVAYWFIIWGPFYLGGLGRRPGWADAANVAWPLVILIGAEVMRSGRERAASAAGSRAELSRRQASEERLRIAQELHDVLAHNISLISVQAGVALHLMDERPDQAADQARTALTAIKQASKEALGELRSVLGLLRASSEQAPLSPVPGMDQLGDLTSRARAAGLAVRADITGDKRPLPADTDLAAYRIVQEALTNVIRHAGARTVTVRVSYGDTGLGIEIQDDGRGVTSGAVNQNARSGRGADGGVHASSKPRAGGNGIAGMRERARLLGGELTARPLPGQGFLVRARLPISRVPGGAGISDSTGAGGGNGADGPATEEGRASPADVSGGREIS